MPEYRVRGQLQDRTVEWKILAETPANAQNIAVKRGMSVEDLWLSSRPAPSRAVKSVAPQMSARSCAVCGSQDAPIRKPKGSAGVAVLLLLLAIIPGVIYLIAYHGDMWVCPSCGAKLGDAT